MGFSEDVALNLLKQIAENYNGKQFRIQIQKDDGTVDRTTPYHLDHLRDEGYVKGTIAADYTVIVLTVTPKGWKYLRQNE